MYSLRRQPILASLSVLAILTSCGVPSREVSVRPPERPVKVTLMDYSGKRPESLSPIEAATAALRYRRDAQVIYLKVAAEELLKQEAVRVATARAASSQVVRVASPVVSAPIAASSASIASVMQCIKDHESGNYAESHNPGGASGAYQYEPGTWQTWSARAGYPSYTYAYQAPPNVQDAVTEYTLTHGGAGNWDPSFGNDPCTLGIR